MSPNRILALGAAALLLYLGFSYGLHTAFPRAEVGYDTALAGRVTRTFLSKGRHSFFLNGRGAPRYDFDAFSRAPAGPERPEATPLSQYLRKGDLIRKQGHAAVLTVQRGDSLTRWVCAP